jgi:squalene-hopene/tetraprenyl-beta-curcumene cyclase
VLAVLCVKYRPAGRYSLLLDRSIAVNQTIGLAPQPRSAIDAAIERAERALLAAQQLDGHWVFELEADATIPAEYIMLEHYLDEIDPDLESAMCAYLRRIQNSDGGWPLFHRGDSDVSATVKAYFALKLAGEAIDAPHMARARERVLALGGAARCNVFTRIALALWGQVPWRAIPVMPVEIVELPRWFPFHVDKISYWSRTVVTPLLVLMALRPRARNPRGVGVRELFVRPPETERHYMRPATPAPLASAFLTLDAVLRALEPCFSRRLRARSIAKAMQFVITRLNGEHGLGAIFPAMANALMAFDALGYAKDHPHRAVAKHAIEKLVVRKPAEAYCQPCTSPVWDTSLTAHALLETGNPGLRHAISRGNQWLRERQVLHVVGDWAVQRPGVRPGGWAFQYWNDFYPDVDDTAVVAMALHRDDPQAYREALERAAEWTLAMQSRDGGWGAFDADNTHFYLNNIPFADHGALLDPPTEDVTARCVGMLLQLGYAKEHPAVARGLGYLRRTQAADGSWFGRWGTNFVYGTWSVLNAFCAAGETIENSETVRRAAEYVLGFQQPDGGWGEDGATYWDERRSLCKESSASQTAWALLALMCAGLRDHPALESGIAYLTRHQNAEGLWDEEWYTAVGFPRVFYLRYHGYRAFFPLFALARYRNVSQRGVKLGAHGF